MKLIERNEYLFSTDQSFYDLKLMHLSDFHIWFSSTLLEKVTEVIWDRKPDLLILTGDYYDFPTGAKLFSKFLKNISSKYTVLFIKGNHDKLYGNKVSRLIENIPNCYCLDHTTFSFIKGQKQYNFSSWTTKKSILNLKTGKNIVLIHNPEKIIENELNGIDLILAGHLHGGQFIFFNTKRGDHFPASLYYKYCIDRVKIKDSVLIVSKGLGDTLPFRINCPKEIINVYI